MSGIPNTITTFMHCAKCIKELPDDMSPQEYSRLEVGFTPTGLQVWCVRHNCNVASFNNKSTEDS